MTKYDATLHLKFASGNQRNFKYDNISLSEFATKVAEALCAVENIKGALFSDLERANVDHLEINLKRRILQ